MKLLFVLGNHPDLSFTEIQTVLGTMPEIDANEYAVFESSREPSDLQNRLAGTVKIAQYLGEFTYINERDLAETLIPLCPEQEGKVIFGASIYGNDGGINPMRIGLELKKHLRTKGVKVRLVTSNNKQLSAADLLKNKVLEHGFEFLLFPKGKRVVVARTLSFQPLEMWSQYDMNRPSRDMKRGMLPPKLARLMVNLSGANTESVLLDPFCGTGTLLEQAALIGVKKLIGSDIDPLAIDSSRENFEHLNSDVGPTLRVSAAKNVSALIEPRSITHLVTEPLLGSPRTGREARFALAKEIESLEQLYQESFIGLKPVLKSKAVIVISLPRHYLGELPMPDRFIELIEKAGFKKEFELLYRHKDQFVGRNIVKFIAP